MDENRDIHRPIQIDNRREPAGVQIARIGGQKYRPRILRPDLDVVRGNGQSRRRKEVGDILRDCLIGFRHGNY